ncbi:MAG: division/cell wall cluster transcriptional repressor MraZ [Thermoleophilaceae bacterium]
MAFRGHYEHSLDAKHRLSIPSKFRASFADGLVLSKDTDACITVSAPAAHEARVKAALEGKNPLGSQFKQIQRYFQGNSFELELDSAGRVVLPSPLLTHAGIEKEVVVTGVDDHLELWSSEGWTDQQALLDQVMGEVTDSLGDPS